MASIVIEGGVGAEYPSRLALIRTSGADATGYVEFWNSDGTTLTNSDSASVVSVTISSTAKSLAQFIWDGNLNRSMSVPGIPDGAVGGALRITSGSVAWNLGGDLVGGATGGTGLASAGTAPTANSPRQTYNVNDVILFGKYRGDE